MKEFGKRKYNQIAYVNFESSKLLNSLFEDDFDIERIISAIQIETGIQIKAEDSLRKDWKLKKSFKTKYNRLLKQYYYIGGMLEAG